MVDQQKPDKAASTKPGSKGSGGPAQRQQGGQSKKQPGGQSGKQRPAAGKGGQGAAGKGKQGAAGKGRLAKGAAARREAERRRRTRALAWTTGVIVVVVALVGLVVWQGRDRSTKLSTPSAAALAQATSTAGCGQVQLFKEAGRNHITAGQQPKNWNSQPPTSGDHLGTPLPPGVYRDQQDERALVHNLEHGYVVVQYKNLPQKQIDLLTGIGDGLHGQKFVLAPYDGLPSDGVALTAWRSLQSCKQANVDVVSAFVNDYMLPGADKSVAPEPNAA
jgi:Protein of unknown function (DUF3105)